MSIKPVRCRKVKFTNMEEAMRILRQMSAGSNTGIYHCPDCGFLHIGYVVAPRRAPAEKK